MTPPAAGSAAALGRRARAVCHTGAVHPLRRTAGLWGPAVFTAAAVVAGRLQPGYSHRRLHISGLAASGQRSALAMIPGIVTLGAATLVMPVRGASVTALTRIAGVGAIAAGAIPASRPRCPRPMIDPEATAADLGHGIAAALAFTAWTATPFVTAVQPGPLWYRGLSRVLRATTGAGFVGAAVTTHLDAPLKGLVQRAFLGSVFTWYVATTFRS